jgi:hypothetical protein
MMRSGAQGEQRGRTRGHVPRWRRQGSQTQVVSRVRAARAGRDGPATRVGRSSSSSQDEDLSQAAGWRPGERWSGRVRPLVMLLVCCAALAFGSHQSLLHDWWLWTPWSEVRFIVGHCDFRMAGVDKRLIYFTWFFLFAGVVVGIPHEAAGRNLVRASLACASASAAIYGASFIEGSIISPRPDPACPPTPTFADQLMSTNGQLATLALEPLLPIAAVLATFAWRARSQADRRWDTRRPGYWGWRGLVAAAHDGAHGVREHGTAGRTVPAEPVDLGQRVPKPRRATDVRHIGLGTARR